MSGEFVSPNPIRSWIGNRFRNLGLGGILVVVLVVALVSGRSPEKLGDNFQIALPLVALGCAVAEGRGVELFGRYLLLEVLIKTPKHTLGDLPINQRPNGGLQGFPSGHTAVSAFGASALVHTCLKSSKSGQAIAIMAAGFVGSSRIDAGKHTIWQVLAGALLGWLVQALALTGLDRMVRRVWTICASKVRKMGQSIGIGIASAVSASALIIVIATPAAAEFELDVYTGWQTSPHSVVSGNDPTGVGSFSFNAGWEGNSFEMPPHYGLRAIYWQNERLGWFADFNHTKIYADSATLGPVGTSGGFEVLEFTDGLNNWTFGPMIKSSNSFGAFTPHVAFGIGIIVPHVEVRSAPGGATTYGYQFGGPSVSLSLGGTMPLNDHASLLVEYKGTYSQMDVDLSGGGRLETNVITNSLNVGVRVKLGRR